MEAHADLGAQELVDVATELRAEAESIQEHVSLTRPAFGGEQELSLANIRLYSDRDHNHLPALHDFTTQQIINSLQIYSIKHRKQAQQMPMLCHLHVLHLLIIS